MQQGIHGCKLLRLHDWMDTQPENQTMQTVEVTGLYVEVN